MSSNKPYIASEEDSVAEGQKEFKNKREQEIEDIKTILATAAGVRFFKRFLADGHVFKTTFTGNSHTFFLEGHRNLALKYLNDITEASPEKLSELMLVKKDGN